MKYRIVQSLRCEYRKVQPIEETDSLVNCPSCGAAICTHEVELSLSTVKKLNRVCKFEKQLKQEKRVAAAKAKEQDAAEMTSFYADHYDENGNWIS